MNSIYRAGVFCAFFLISGAVEAGEKSDAAVYMVYREDHPVLRMVDAPGVLVSTALPPPGMPPRRHEFLSASALDPLEEDRMGRILDVSANTTEFIENLEKAGYRVTREQGAP